MGTLSEQPHVKCPLCGKPMPERWSEGAGGNIRPVCGDCWQAAYHELVLERLLQDPTPGAARRTRLDGLLQSYQLAARVPCEAPPPPPPRERPPKKDRQLEIETRLATLLVEDPAHTAKQYDRLLGCRVGTCGRILVRWGGEGIAKLAPVPSGRHRNVRLWVPKNWQPPSNEQNGQTT